MLRALAQIFPASLGHRIELATFRSIHLSLIFREPLSHSYHYCYNGYHYYHYRKRTKTVVVDRLRCTCDRLKQMGVCKVDSILFIHLT